MPAIPEYERTYGRYDLVFEPRIYARSSHAILHRKRDIFVWSFSLYARTVGVLAILHMAIDLLLVRFEKILVMTAFKLELEDKLER